MYQKPLLISQVSHPLDVAPCRHPPAVAETSSGHVPPPLLIRIIFYHISREDSYFSGIPHFKKR
jgi:hypothetical protein